ncbi:MAG: peroxiredoxin [Erythrobacter sp.]|uniref:peroxiredoxin n=1 Tax=Erythrobacter sp. TaxID=1042 RepID=UPI0026125EA4|nr:peroxiredoxin [Erythrobacter sp.]MDJ0977835.1 peroxiredoxin [Erythrobacter sp.]
MITRTRLFAAAALALAIATPAHADLDEGTKAPIFTTKAAMAGKEFGFSLATALKQGPVVLYFYPKAFTSGCTLEANAFAEAMPQFKAAGASVIGMSSDDIETLKRFSREECRDAFPVGVASLDLLEDYDVGGPSSPYASRTSYVIASDGRIATVYTNGDYREHVSRTLAAVKNLSK